MRVPTNWTIIILQKNRIGNKLVTLKVLHYLSDLKLHLKKIGFTMLWVLHVFTQQIRNLHTLKVIAYEYLLKETLNQLQFCRRHNRVPGTHEVIKMLFLIYKRSYVDLNIKILCQYYSLTTKRQMIRGLFLRGFIANSKLLVKTRITYVFIFGVSLTLFKSSHVV